MRMWSFHPKYLDNVGLNRAINESIAGYKALIKTKEGYPLAWEKHPQLERFKNTLFGNVLLRQYIKYLLDYKYALQMKQLGYNSYIGLFICENFQSVNIQQLKYEWNHYLVKLLKRNKDLYNDLKNIELPDPHPLFKIVNGEIENWERVK